MAAPFGSAGPNLFQTIEVWFLCMKKPKKHRHFENHYPNLIKSHVLRKIPHCDQYLLYLLSLGIVGYDDDDEMTVSLTKMKVILI